MILLRADGTPTYMLAVVVDDHDMGVTHVIRGDDHLNNAFRQLQIIERHGLARAGLCPHPADPRPRRRQAQQAPRRARRRRLSRHGLPAGGAAQLPAAAGLGPWRRRDHLDRAGDRMVRPAGRRPLGRRASTWPSSPTSTRTTCARRPMPSCCRWCCRASRPRSAARSIAVGLERIERGMNGVKQRSRTLVELADNLVFYARRRRAADRRRQGARASSRPKQGAARPARRGARGRSNDWSEKHVEDAIRRFAEAEGVKLGQVAQPLRVALTRLDRVARHLRGAGDPGSGRDQARLLAASG